MIREFLQSAGLLACTIALSGGTTCWGQRKHAAAPEEKPADALARAVHHQILVLPFYSVFDTVSFVMDGDKVVLTGQVMRPSLKASAEGMVKSLEGIRSVENRIEVLPASASDDELRRAVYRAIFEDKTLERYAIQAVPPIHIIVKNGSVTLTGSVDSLSDKTLATTRASQAPNVGNISNNLAVVAR
jgi:hyperosmotically inducible protein